MSGIKNAKSTMKQMIMEGPKKSILIDVPLPQINDDQILVKVNYCGVCMSEHDDWKIASYGRIFGHEPMGIVAKVGKNVEGYKEGDRVSGLALGSFAEYTVFNKNTILHVPDNIRDEDATAEPLSCLISAASKLPITVPGDTAVVIGTGYMGLGMVSLFKLKGAGKIIGIDIRKEALENALQYGATEVYYPNEIPKEYLAPMSDIYGGGLPLVTEWAGEEEALRLAAEMTAIDGTLGVGAYHTGGDRKVDMQLWNVKALSVVSTHERKEDFQMRCCRQAFELLSSGQWQFQNLNTKIYALSEFDLAQKEIIEKPNNLIKALIDCREW